MKIVLTGGAGYIGSHVLADLLSLNKSVHVVDNFYNSSPASLTAVQNMSKREFAVSELNILNGPGLDKLLQETRPSAVMHFAGLKAVSESVSHPLFYYENNVKGTLELLKAMDNSGCKNLIFSSSATVYGVPERLPISEDHKVAAINPYGRTKLIIEGMINDWSSTDPKKSVIILRYFNPVGAHPSGRIGESPKGVPNNLMPFLSQVASGRLEVLKVFGNDYDTEDGTGIRDYIHICDLASGHIAALDYCLKTSGVETFNLGTGRGYSVIEMVNAFKKASGRPIPYCIVPRRSGDVAECYADVSKVKKILNWEAKLSINDMCADSWRWQHLHPDGHCV
jgi:UDP-glucose 4-epimerase